MTASRLSWLARSIHRAFKVARTIADLAGAPSAQVSNVAKAMQYQWPCVPASIKEHRQGDTQVKPSKPTHRFDAAFVMRLSLAQLISWKATWA